MMTMRMKQKKTKTKTKEELPNLKRDIVRKTHVLELDAVDAAAPLH
jgi:hypothetical protein